MIMQMSWGSAFWQTTLYIIGVDYATRMNLYNLVFRMVFLIKNCFQVGISTSATTAPPPPSVAILFIYPTRIKIIRIVSYKFVYRGSRVYPNGHLNPISNPTPP